MTNTKNSNRFMLILIIWIIPASLIAVALTSTIDASIGVSITLSQVIAFGIPSIVVLAINRKRIKQILPTKKMGIKNYLMIIAMSLFIQPLLMFISTVMSQFLPNISSEMLSGMTTDTNFILTLLFIAVVPSVFEELVFRGIIFSGYKEVPIFKAALINGVMFGMMHLNFHQFFHTVVLGFILCFFVYYTKSVISAILAHFVVNGTQAGFSLWQTRTHTEIAYYDEPSMLLALFIIGVFAAAGLAIFVLIYKKFKSHNMSSIDHPEEDMVEQDGIVPPAPVKKPTLLTVPVYVTAALFVLFAFITLLPSFMHSCPYC